MENKQTNIFRNHERCTPWHLWVIGLLFFLYMVTVYMIIL